MPSHQPHFLPSPCPLSPPSLALTLITLTSFCHPTQGYSRKGTALLYLNNNQTALQTFQNGLALDPNNQQLKEGLAESKRRVSG